MTLEHLFFVPFILCLGIVLGGQLTHWRLTKASAPVRRVGVWSVAVPLTALVVLFLLTHVVSTHGGAKAVEDSLGGQSLFDQRASYGAQEVNARLEGFGPQGRSLYQRMTFTTDLLFPLTLCLFLIQLVRFVNERALVALGVRRLGLALAPLWLLTDLCENAIIYRLLGIYPASDDALAQVLGPVTHLKFAMLVGCVAYCAALSLATSRDPIDRS